MERKSLPPYIPCPSNERESCKYFPNCSDQSRHHILPRRLVKIAEEAGAGKDYLTRLQRLVRHPTNKIITCRMIHDFLDQHTSDELPSEEYIDRRLYGIQET